MRIRIGLLAVIAWVMAGCSLSLDFSGDCLTDDGCAARGGNFICQDGTCVFDESPQEDMGPTVDMGEPEPEICVELLENGCTEIYGANGDTTAEREADYLTNRDAYVLVSVHPPHGGFGGTALDQIKEATRVIVDDVNEQGSFSQINGKRLAVLICNDGAAQLEVGVEAANHAIDCGAKALIGAYDSGPTIELYREVARERNVPIISPGAITPAIPDIRTSVGSEDNDNLLWRVKVPGDVTARSVGSLVKTLRRHRNIKVLYRDSDPYGVKMFEALERAMCNNTDFCSGQMAGPDTADVEPVAYSQPIGMDLRMEIAGRVADPEIDLIITLNSALEDLLDLLNGVTDANPVADIITVEGARSTLAMDLFLSGGVTPERLDVICRILGVSSGTIGAGRPNWLSFLELYSDVSGDDLFAPTPPFADAMFVTAFAIAAAASADPAGEVTTEGIQAGLELVSDKGGPTILPHQWAEGLAAMNGDMGGVSTINFEGASGAVDLDGSTNDVTDQRTEAWQYALLDGERDSRAVETLANPLTDVDGMLNPSILDGLVRPMASVCQPHPYLHLLDSE